MCTYSTEEWQETLHAIISTTCKCKALLKLQPGSSSHTLPVWRIHAFAITADLI